jgi:hypothetical protein
MQNIMASRYIVAQQRRHGAFQGSGEIVGVLEGSPAQHGKPVYRSYNQPDVLGCQHYKRRCAFGSIHIFSFSGHVCLEKHSVTTQNRKSLVYAAYNPLLADLNLSVPY